MLRQANQMREAQEAGGQGPSAAPPPPAQFITGADVAYFDIDMEEPAVGPGVGALAGPGAELTREERIAKEQRAWRAGGWSDEIPRRRYAALLFSSLVI